MGEINVYDIIMVDNQKEKNMEI